MFLCHLLFFKYFNRLNYLCIVYQLSSFQNSHLFIKNLYLLKTFQDIVSSGIIPAPHKNSPNTMNTIPICNIPMLVTTLHNKCTYIKS